MIIGAIIRENNMKITKSYLREVIMEELQNMQEAGLPPPPQQGGATDATKYFLEKIVTPLKGLASTYMPDKLRAKYKGVRDTSDNVNPAVHRDMQGHVLVANEIYQDLLSTYKSALQNPNNFAQEIQYDVQKINRLATTYPDIFRDINTNYGAYFEKLGEMLGFGKRLLLTTNK